MIKLIFKNQKGFTLIEMLIVVAIIGILSAVILVGLGPTQRTGRDARRLADLKQVQTALELYFQKEGQYPNANSWTDLRNALKNAQIGVSDIPNDPTKGQDYLYSVNSPGSSYVLGAKLEDKNNPAWKSSISPSPGSYPNTGSCYDGSGSSGEPSIGTSYYCLVF